MCDGQSSPSGYLADALYILYDKCHHTYVYTIPQMSSHNLMTDQMPVNQPWKMRNINRRWWINNDQTKQTLQYIPRNMHAVFALLCFVVVIHWLIFPYPSGLLHWHCGNLTIAPVPAKQPWWIWINTSSEFMMNDCITTTKQSTTKPCAYFLGYTVWCAYFVGHGMHGYLLIYPWHLPKWSQLIFTVMPNWFTSSMWKFTTYIQAGPYRCQRVRHHEQVSIQFYGPQFVFCVKKTKWLFIGLVGVLWKFPGERRSV